MICCRIQKPRDVENLFFCRSPDEWTETGRVDPSVELVLTFALKQENVDLLQEVLRLVSDPDSAQYGRTMVWN